VRRTTVPALTCSALPCFILATRVVLSIALVGLVTSHSTGAASRRTLPARTALRDTTLAGICTTHIRAIRHAALRKASCAGRILTSEVLWAKRNAVLPAHVRIRGVAPDAGFAVRVAAVIGNSGLLFCHIRVEVLVNRFAIPTLASPAAQSLALTAPVVCTVTT